MSSVKNRPQYCAAADDLYAKLAEIVRAEQADDPFSPVSVIVPSRLAAQSLRKDLAARLPRGTLNVRYLQLSGLLYELSALSMSRSGKRIASAGVISVAIYRALTEQKLARWQSQPFLQLLEGLYGALAPLTDEVLGELAGRRGTDAKFAGVVLRARQLLSAYLNYREVQAIAAENEDGLRRLGKIVVLNSTVPPAQYQLLWDALVRREGTARLVLLSGHQASDSLLGADVGAAGAAGAPTGLAERASELTFGVKNRLRFMGARDSTEEKRILASQIAQNIAAGTPAQRIGVVCPNLAYCDEIVNALRLSGIPVANLKADTSAAGAIKRLVQLAFSSGGGGANGDSGGENSLAAAELFKAVKAGVLKLPAQAVRRDFVYLLKHISSYRPAVWRAQIREAARQASGDAGADLREQGEVLIEWLDHLIRDFAIPNLKSWGGYSDWLGRLIAGYCKFAPDSSADDSGAAIAAEMWREMDLARLTAPTGEHFQRLVVAELDSAASKLQFGKSGVLVAPSGHLGGARMRQIYVVGMYDGFFPPSVAPSQITLPRELRAKHNVPPSILPSAADQLAAYKGTFLSIINSAEAACLIWPQFDGERNTIPSQWYIELLKQRSGGDGGGGGAEADAVSVDDIVKGRQAQVEYVDSETWADYLPLGRVEFDRLSVLRGNSATVRDLRALAQVKTSIAAMAKLASDDWNEFRGNLTSISDKLRKSSLKISAAGWSQLEACPYEYFVGYQLGIKTPQTEEDATISHLNRGNLVHAILNQFARRRAELKLDAHDMDQQQKLLSEVVEKHFREIERTKNTGYPALWVYERRRLARDLNLWLALDNERALGGFLQLGSEVRFEYTEQIALDGGGDAVELVQRGWIDRIDVNHEAREIFISDYKTGKSGDDLQLQVYRDAVRRLPEYDTDANAVGAGFWYVCGRERRIAPAELPPDTAEAKANMARHIVGGVYPPFFDHYCEYCEAAVYKAPRDGELADKFRRGELLPGR